LKLAHVVDDSTDHFRKERSVVPHRTKKISVSHQLTTENPFYLLLDLSLPKTTMKISIASVLSALVVASLSNSTYYHPIIVMLKSIAALNVFFRNHFCS
jgi:hypothetical protein